MGVLKDELVRIVDEEKPTTVRHVFYKAVAKGLIPKTEAAYKKVVVRLLTELRDSHAIPYQSISDSTRWIMQARTYGSAQEALEDAWRGYRRNLWTNVNERVEIWCEKDALAGVLTEVAYKWHVPTMVFRGYSSVSYLYQLADQIMAHGLPTFIYYFGDHDPSGHDIERHVTKRIRKMAPDAEIHIKRVAVTPAQIKQYDLPTRPTKKTDSRAKHFKGESVEVDALDSKVLQAIAEKAIRSHLDEDEIARVRYFELEEKAGLALLSRGGLSLLAKGGLATLTKAMKGKRDVA